MRSLKKKNVLIATLILFLAGIGLFFIFIWKKDDGAGRLYAEIMYAEEMVKKVYLDQDTTFSPEHNPRLKIEVKDGAIAFIQSDCPDRLCVEMGAQREKGGFAACLPNRVMFIIESENFAGLDVIVR